MGKTHYASALGMKACLENKKILFINLPNLIIELKEAMSHNQITRYKEQFERYDLVIVDELGYVSFDRWEEIFKDPIFTIAIVDRLAFKSNIINISKDSYWTKEGKDWLEKSLTLTGNTAQ